MMLKGRDKSQSIARNQSINPDFSAFVGFSGLFGNESYLSTKKMKDECCWIIDSGARRHMCSSLSMFHKYRPVKRR